MTEHIVVVEGFEDWNTWYENGEVETSEVNYEYEFYQNQGVVLKGSGCKEHGLVKGEKIVRIKPYSPCNISPRNSEQTIAAALLQDKNISLKVLSGVAGSGKTLLACAHALHRLKNGKDKIAKILIAKSMAPVGRDIGFLPGSIDEKIAPWMGAYWDNFLNCGYSSQDIETMVEHEELEIVSIAHIQGRSISNAIMIIDEVQNLDLNVLKQLISRAAEGTEIILLGDQSQVFEYANRDASLDILLERGRNSPLVGTIHLIKSVRSPIARWAVENL